MIENNAIGYEIFQLLDLTLNVPLDGSSLIGERHSWLLVGPRSLIKKASMSS